MRIRVVMAVVVAGSLLAASSASADAEACRAARDHYKSTFDDLASALRRYAKCLEGAAGHDDCSSEFRRLKSEQDDFEEATEQLQPACDGE